MSQNDRSAPEIASELDAAVVKKALEPLHGLLLLGMLAGAYIGFGGIAATNVIAYKGDMPMTLVKFLAGSVFSVGLILVVIPGSELFTGNVLMVAGLLSRRVSLGRVLRNWVLVYAGNFLGAALLTLVLFGSGMLDSGPLHDTAIALAGLRLKETFLQAMLRGVLCNMLVCLAVILAMSARSTEGKILGIYFPIMTFVLCGFEHSIANMYFLSAGGMADGSFWTLSAWGPMWYHLAAVTIGNILGGLLIIGLHPRRLKQLARTIHAGEKK